MLAEKGSGDNDDVELIRAAAGFRLVATMNPGGDFGKKEVKKSCGACSEIHFEWKKCALQMPTEPNLKFDLYFICYVFLDSCLLRSETVLLKSGVHKAIAGVT